MNNPSLNNILDGDSYTAVLVFGGSIIAPGTYNLTGASLAFHDIAASASETGFNSVSLTVTANGSFDDIGLLGCLSTGSGCFFGNQMDANFQIAAASLTSANVSAGAIPLLTPSLDLLEDDGATDIKGSVTQYSYVSAVPEPSPLILLGFLLLAVLAWPLLRRPWLA